MPEHDELLELIRSLPCADRGERLARIETKLDVLVAQADTSITLMREQNHRVGKLEAWRSWVLGAAAAVGALCGATIKTLLGQGGGKP